MAELETTPTKSATVQNGPAKKKKPPPKQRLLDPETRSYFENVEQLLQDTIEDEEEKTLLIEKVYKEMDGHEAHLVTDPDCSRILEKVLSMSTHKQARWLLSKMVGDFAFVMTHRNGSHVLQTLLSFVPDWIQEETKEEEEAQDQAEPLLFFKDLIPILVKEIEPSARELCTDTFASHVLRVIINVLSGRPVELLARSKSSKTFREKSELSTSVPVEESQPRAVPAEFVESLRQLSTAIVGDDDTSDDVISEVREMARSRVAAPVLQLLLLAHSNNRSILADLLNRLLKDRDSPPLLSQQYKSPFIETSLKDEVASHVLERILQVAPPEIYLGLYVAHFRGQLLELARHPVANFVVAQLVASSKSPVHVDMLLDELVPNLDELLSSSRGGIVYRMVEVAAKYPGPRQKRLMQAISRCLNGHLPNYRKELLQLILYLRKAPSDGAVKTWHDAPIHAIGAQIVQSLFGFAEAELVPLILSLMSVTTATLITWCQDFGGSRVIESFLKSKASIELKHKLIQKLAGNFAKLACDKYGSHTLDVCWAQADIALKEKIAQELVDEHHQLANNYYGRFVLRNCRVLQYKQRKEDWREKEQGKHRKLALFSDLLGDDVTSTASTTTNRTAKAVDANQETIKRLENEYDEHLVALGFSRTSFRPTTEDSASKGKGKKNKRAKKTEKTEDEDLHGNNAQKLILQEEDEPEQAQPAEKEAEDEDSAQIDLLFNKAPPHTTTKTNSHNNNKTATASSKRPAADLVGVLDAIENTRKKKKAKSNHNNNNNKTEQQKPQTTKAHKKTKVQYAS